ncbi:MAG TPA: hypothetical protein VG095_04805, partial [Chthoniobacterales bacterium]|nr:hypothetical protein [Chthoniobacterales bacterium]
MRFTPSFYRAAAVCSVLSAITTLLLIFLPKFYGPATSFEHRLALVHHPLFQLRAWAYLLHPFLVMTAALGVAAALRRIAANTVVPGFLGFLLWGFTEAAQQTLTLTVFRRWAVQFAAADAATRETLRNNIGIYDAIWDAMFLLLLFGFLAANILYALATLRGVGLTRVLSFFYFGAAFLTLIGISAELQGPTLPPLLSTWLYPLLQPAARVLIGVWLWR